MGGGGAEVIYLNWCWGGQFFWVDRIAPSKKIKTSTIWKDFCDKRLPQKLLWGASPIMPPHAEKRDPPPPTHGKNRMAPAYVERKDCPHKIYPHRGNSPPPRWIFFIHASPTWRAPVSPPCVRRS